MSSARDRRNYSQSVSLRKVAHQVLNSEECQTFKEALKVFRCTRTTEQFVDYLEPILDSPKKLNLLREIVLLLPAAQRPEFAELCRSRFKGAELLLRDSHIAAEFEQRFGQKMASLSLGRGGMSKQGVDGGVGSIGDASRTLNTRTSAGAKFDVRRSTGRSSLSGAIRISDATAAAAAAAAAAQRLRAAAVSAANERITLSDSAQIRKLSDDRATSVIKLRSATFQVRYRSKLPLFSSEEEEPPIAAAAAGMASILSTAGSSGARDDFDDNDESSGDYDEDDSDDNDVEDARLNGVSATTTAAKSRLPLSELRDKGFWALNSPRRALEEKLKQQKDLQSTLAFSPGEPEERRRRPQHRQRHRRRRTTDGRSNSHGDGSAADTPTNQAVVEQQIYRLLYAPSATAAGRSEDQASLTSSQLEGEFLKSRHPRAVVGVPASLPEDFDAAPMSLDSGVERQRLHGLPETSDREVQCDLAAEFQTASQSLPRPQIGANSMPPPPPLPPFGYCFVPISAHYAGSHLFHHSVASPMYTINSGGYFPWSQFWSQGLQQQQQQQQFGQASSFYLSRPPRPPVNQQSADRLKRVTLLKEPRSDSFGLSVRVATARELLTMQRAHRSPFVIASVATGSPAYDEGIQPGDQLLEVEGESVANMTLQQLALAVRSRPRIRLSLAPADRGDNASTGREDQCV